MTIGKLLSQENTRNMSSLAKEIQTKRERKNILLMAHQILGYPNFDTNYEMIRLFSECGVDLVELQLPFSEPVADGPVFLKANQEALTRGTTVQQCLEFAQRVTKDFNLPFVFMTYYNILFQYGIESFIQTASGIGIRGLIVPDALPEESVEYLSACKKHGVDSILLVTPYTPNERMEYIARETDGFLYCVARKGVTGARTAFDEATMDFISRCSQFASTPIGVGFGIQHADDIRSLIDNCDIAIIGSQLLKVLERQGQAGVSKFLTSLRIV